MSPGSTGAKNFLKSIARGCLENGIIFFIENGNAESAECGIDIEQLNFLFLAVIELIVNGRIFCANAAVLFVCISSSSKFLQLVFFLPQHTHLSARYLQPCQRLCMVAKGC